jgi:hypothetical protein
VAFSFSSCSFFCFNWFSLLSRELSSVQKESLETYSRISLGFSKRFTAANFLVFFALPLTEIQKLLFLSKKPLTIVVDVEKQKLSYVRGRVCTWRRHGVAAFSFHFISSLTANWNNESTTPLNLNLNQPFLAMGEAWDIYPHSRSPHSSPTAQATRARASLRPPVFNPYDRFTQPEFDAWIGDITSALKNALSPDAEAEVDSPSLRSSSWNTIPDKIGGTLSAERRAQSPALSEGRDYESALEDSFAQIASRRAKGKARDPREGPGLGLKGQPIELSSDSEEEEVVDSLEAGALLSEDSDASAQEDSGGETDYAESELDEDGDASSAWPGTSTQHIVELSSNENTGQDQEVASPSDVEAHRTGYEDLQSHRHTAAFREDGGDGNASFAVLRKRGTSDSAS